MLIEGLVIKTEVFLKVEQMRTVAALAAVSASLFSLLSSEFSFEWPEIFIVLKSFGFLMSSSRSKTYWFFLLGCSMEVKIPLCFHSM